VRRIGVRHQKAIRPALVPPRHVRCPGQRQLDHVRRPAAAPTDASAYTMPSVPCARMEFLRGPRGSEFERRFAALREKHLSKPTLIARLDRAGLTA
jgi:hypothetical protein